MTSKDKVVIITGASSGFGEAHAERFLQVGARVTCADLVEPRSPTLRGQRRFVRTDISVEGDIRSLVEDVTSREEHIDAFVSNAGVSKPMDASAAEEDWRRIVAINQMSHVWAARHVLPAMVKRGAGRFIITASASSFLCEITSVGYATTKYAAFEFAEWLAFSYRGRGICVSAIAPGPIWTPLIADIPYLHDGAITSKEAVDAIFGDLARGRFFITTHPITAEQFRQKAADVDSYVDFLASFRDRALALSEGRV